MTPGFSRRAGLAPRCSLTLSRVALIHEAFGDGIMRAIDFEMDLRREPHAAGDRVDIQMSGKFLPYKTY